MVVSHPDDAEFGAGPTIALLAAAGARVDYVVTTDGAKGTEDPTVTPEQLSTTRHAEQRAAADILGVSDIVHLGYPDGYLEPTLDLRRDVTRQIRRFRPDLVITQNPQRRLDHNPFIGHPDHLATGEATLASVYPAARDHLNFPELWTDEHLEPWKVRQVLLTGVEEPNLWLDVARHLRDRAARRSWPTPARSTPTTSRSGCASGHAWSESRRGSAWRRRSSRSCSNDPARRQVAAVLGRRSGSGPDAPAGQRGPTLRRIAGFFRPYRVRLAFIAVLILITVSIGVVNPILLKLVIDNLTGRPQDLEPALAPVRADDRAADHHQRARRLAVVPVERRRPAGHERPAPRALPPPAVDAAALLHRDAHRRDPEPHRQRRRRGAVGRDRYGRIGPQQRRHGR